MKERVSECANECVRGCEQASARGLPRSSPESAFSGVYKVPKGARPHARAASHRAVLRVCLVAFPRECLIEKIQ